MVLLLAAGCASVDPDATLARVSRETAGLGGGTVALARTDDQRAAAGRRVEDLLQRPVGQQDAVEIALAGNPAVQAALASGWADVMQAAQGGALPNPVFALTRLRSAAELDFERALGIGLFELLTLPQRRDAARWRGEETELRLVGQVVDQLTQVRQAWVGAVAAREQHGYCRQILDSAEAGAELARRMQEVGNLNKLARARQQAFYADAAARCAQARQSATAAREALVRALGLTDGQAMRLTLPERLPDLPRSPRGADELGAIATANRLDIRVARARLAAAAAAEGLTLPASLVDVELTLRRDTHFDASGEPGKPARGFEVAIRLPLLDQGEFRRGAAGARSLAAAYELEAAARAASSGLREDYAAYRTAYDVAVHYRDEIIPLRRTIADENVLRYNGMLTGVFELLEDAREQIRSVTQAMAAVRDFWLADAALQATLMGRPAAGRNGAMRIDTAETGGGNAGH